MSGPLTSSHNGVPATPIAGISQPTLSQYFHRFNSGDFQAVSHLFAVDGVLQPPFEDQVVGREAIVAYLEQEATGYALQPQTGRATPLENGCLEIEVAGQVQTPWFSVNVQWTFVLSPSQEICLVKVKLFASMQELLPLRDISK